MDLMEAYTEMPVQKEVYSCHEKILFMCLQLLYQILEKKSLEIFAKRYSTPG